MDKDIAQNLFNELSKHEGIIKPEESIFLNMLDNFEIKDSSRFYEDFPNIEQVLNNNSEAYSSLSLRRIIRNKNAVNYQLKGLKKIGAEICDKLNIYSSTILLRKLREDESIIGLMEESSKKGNPFSLLGKFENYDYGNPKEILYISRTPILIIPEITNHSIIKEWEDNKTKYSKQEYFWEKKISKKEYLNQGLEN